MSIELLPGDLLVVDSFALVRRWGSEDEHYTGPYQMCIVISKHHSWSEPGQFGDRAYQCYLVLFSNDSRMYVVPGNKLLQPDRIKDPGRLFGPAHGLTHK